MNSDTPGVVVSEFSGVSDPTPRMVTRFSKPEALVICRLGTRPFRPAAVLMNDLSRRWAGTAVMASAERCRLVERRSAVTMTSLTADPAGAAAAARVAGEAAWAW